MKRVAVLALAVSLCLNLALLMRTQEAGAGASRNAPARVEAPAPPSVPAARRSPSNTIASAPAAAKDESLAERRVELEKEFVALEAEAVVAKALGPVDRILAMTGDLLAKLRAIAALAEPERSQAVEALASQMLKTDTILADEMDALARLEEPGALECLAALIQRTAGCDVMLHPWPPEAKAKMLDALEHGEPAERRFAAAYFVAERAVEDDITPDWTRVVASALRADPDPRVVRTIASYLGNCPAQDIAPEVADALRAAELRSTSEESRRLCLFVLGAVTFFHDGGDELARRWQGAPAGPAREDLAQAYASAATRLENQGSGADAPAWAREASPDRRAFFVELYSGTTKLETRQRLVSVLEGGIGVVAPTTAAQAAFVREIVEREPDAAQRERLLRLAAELERGKTIGDPASLKILFGRN